MNAQEFHNALRIMWNLDHHVLVEAGVFDSDDEGGWRAFRDHPHNQAIRLNDDRFARLFDLIQSRQPKPISPAVCAEFMGVDFEDRSGEAL